MSTTLQKARARFGAPPPEPKHEPEPPPLSEHDQQRLDGSSKYTDPGTGTVNLRLPSGMVIQMPPFTAADENHLNNGFRKTRGDALREIEVINGYFRMRMKVLDYGPYPDAPFHVSDMFKSDWDFFTESLKSHIQGELI